MNNLEVGALTGQIIGLVEVAAADCDATVYLFDADAENALVEPADALTSAMVDTQMNELEEKTEYHYTFGFLPGGDYEIAFGCDGDMSLIPEDGKAATVVVGEVTTVDLP